MATGVTGLSSPHPCAPDVFTFPDILGTRHRVTTAETVKGFTVGPEGASFCNVTVSYTHPGHDDLVNIHIWLPLTGFNSRFVGIGGGGWLAGEIGDDAMSAFTYQGYATAATDAGYQHDVFSTADAWLMKHHGNLDYPLLTNFAHRAVHEMAIIGKHMGEEYYGQPPAFSYWSGCSTGGRQGLTSALLYPDDYDGILTSCPAVSFPSLMVAFFWSQSVMNRIGAYPEACQFEAVRLAAVETCDELDGSKDGIISRDDLCDFDPNTVVSKGFNCNGVPAKISKETAEIVKAMLQGPTDPEGNSLFPGSTHGTSAVGLMALGNTRCEGGKCTGLPFTLATDWIRLLLKKDPSFDVTTLSLEEYSQLMHQSVREYNGMFAADDADLGRFRGSGKKMITWHGINDEAITINAMRRYYKAVMALDESRGVDTRSYYRYFEVPGATHCSAPPGVGYPLHALDVLRQWVEEGIVPEMLQTTRIGGVSDEEQLPLCPYPHIPVKKGNVVVCQERKKAHNEHLNTKDEL
ncbi:Tannase/feruloyl esterase [Thelonectria olida]|uniref:Carboxylic ester hydrolase n=1 Tax=Thelonectria olida TaxID=1576542 RepID=A0A9P8W0K2_9HYPO|nr:Tannase/feruloyl esterase [Thelonectria olida]